MEFLILDHCAFFQILGFYFQVIQVAFTFNQLFHIILQNTFDFISLEIIWKYRMVDQILKMTKA